MYNSSDRTIKPKRMSSQLREENYEHVLMCLICRSLFDDNEHQPKFLPCHHTFCKDCLKEYIRQNGDDLECPSCRKLATVPAAGVTALQTNYYVKYIQVLVQGSFGIEVNATECIKHPNHHFTHYCKDCESPVCTQCCQISPAESEGKETATCSQHQKIPLTAIKEESHQALDSSFSKTNTLIERKKAESEALLKSLCQEKDQALLKIDSTFEQHIHTLSRRATLLKNKVIDIYNEHVTKLENNLEEIATAMTCIVSLKEYHDKKIEQCIFKETERGLSEIEDLYDNISTKIRPSENHIIFEEKHSVEKFTTSVRDLGRVKSNHSHLQRREPEGGRDNSPNIEAQPFESMRTSLVQSSQLQDNFDCGEISTKQDVSSENFLSSTCLPSNGAFSNARAYAGNMLTTASFQFPYADTNKESAYPNSNLDVSPILKQSEKSKIFDKNANTDDEVKKGLMDPNSNIEPLIVRPKSFDTVFSKIPKKKKVPTATLR